jgi:hypothetical protein
VALPVAANHHLIVCRSSSFPSWSDAPQLPVDVVAAVAVLLPCAAAADGLPAGDTHRG